MKCKWLAPIVAIVGFSSYSRSQHTPVRLPTAQDCKQATLTRPGEGLAYRGMFSNEDYDFSAHVPAGLTAWGGVDEFAPFHGFTIFLDSKEQSCIVFEIHLRIDDSDAIVRPSKVKTILLGKAKGWQESRVGVIKGVRLNNIVTSFSFKRSDEIDDGIVLLVAPSSQMRKALSTYQEFLHSVVFGH